MTLEKLLNEREQWQDNTVSSIRDKLLFKPSLMIENAAKEEKLVVIYGPPQIGKTTLILQLLGIAEQYQRDIYDVLRAGVPKGNSSTSTAIIYQQCDGERFGMKYGKINDIGGDIEFFKEQELKEKLRYVRSSVESNQARKDILYIYIPKKFFFNKAEKYSNINILDLPGDGSRNLRERSHVNQLMKKYMAIASVNIIVCKANEIQSLEDLVLPINVDWRNLPHKYIVVITNSYGQGTIKKYFKQTKRKCSFDDFVRDQYRSSMGRIINPITGIEYFPIDLGESLNRLINSGLCKEDQEEVRKTAAKVTEEIRKSIQNKNGNSLKSAIMELNAYSSDYAINKCDEIKREIADLQGEINLENKKNEKEKLNISDYDKEIKDLTPVHNFYTLLNQIKISDYSYSYEIFKKDFLNELEKFVKDGKVVDKDKKLIAKLTEILIKYTDSLVSELNRKLKKTFISSSPEEVYREANFWVQVESEIDSEFYSGGLFKEIFIGKPKKSEYIQKIEDAFESYSKQLLEYLDELKKKEIRKSEATEKRYNQFCRGKTLCERAIENHSANVRELQEQLSAKESEYKEINENRNSDQLQIKEYSQIAHHEYSKQMKDLRERLESKDTSATEKLYLLIFMALIEKDYQNIIRMV